MSKQLLRQFIVESLQDASFLQHLRLGLGYARGDAHAEARQIVDDWLAEVEVRRGGLLSPGRVAQAERFVASSWPGVLEQFRGDKGMALWSMLNMLDAEYGGDR